MEQLKMKCPKCRTIHTVPVGLIDQHCNCLKCGSWINSGVHKYVESKNKQLTFEILRIIFCLLVVILFLYNIDMIMGIIIGLGTLILSLAGGLLTIGVIFFPFTVIILLLLILMKKNN